MKAIAIVAHDDDVVLWLGGTIHLLKDWEWHIISMCNDHNSERKNYFYGVADKLGVATINTFDFFDYQDRKTSHRTNSIPDMKEKLSSLLKDNRYDYVFTHSRDKNGEYGHHANHQEVCEAVQSLASENLIVENPNRLAFFCYSPLYDLPGLPTVARKDAKAYMQLPYSDLAFKIGLIQSHNPGVVNNLQNDLGSPCPNPEAFEGDDLCLPTPFINRNLWSANQSLVRTQTRKRGQNYFLTFRPKVGGQVCR
ncbi:MAG: PIG-L family deacetylase [Desulfobulbaceae bacterium]|nr:PIG-L family deacetylase [Desulfobulbaceae bacterium]